MQPLPATGPQPLARSSEGSEGHGIDKYIGQSAARQTHGGQLVDKRMGIPQRQGAQGQ